MKRKIAGALAGLMGAVMLAGAAGAAGEETADMQVRIDPANVSRVNDGIFEGWGTSLCWWANRIGYSDSLAEKAAEAFCDPE